VIPLIAEKEKREGVQETSGRGKTEVAFRPRRGSRRTDEPERKTKKEEKTSGFFIIPERKGGVPFATKSFVLRWRRRERGEVSSFKTKNREKREGGIRSGRFGKID